MIRSYRPEDLEQIAKWAEAWKQELPSVMPEIGFIVDEIAACFLLRAECGVCFIEGYINNPEAGKMERQNAEDEITNALLSYAKESGFTKVLVITSNPFIKHRAETKFDFRAIKNAEILSRGV